MRKAVCTAVAVITAFSLCVMPAAASEIDVLESQKAAAESEVATLQSDLESLVEAVDQLEQDLIVKGEEIAEVQADLDAAEKKEEEQRTAMGLRIKYMYEEGNPSLMNAILASENLAEVLNKAEYAKDISSYDRDMILAYIATQNEITEIKTTLEEEQAQMQELQTEYEAQQGILNTLIASKQEEVANFDSLLAQAYAAEEARQAAAAAGPAYYAYDEASGEYYYSNDGETFYSASGNVAYSEDFGSAIVAAALGQLGTPYQWGAQNPGYGFDCSGLVQYVYGQSGISIPRTSGEIFANGTIVTDPQPGDICWTPGHVGIYYGDGKMIHAPQDGETVSVSDAKATYYIRY